MKEMEDMLFNRLHALMDKGQSGVIAILDDGTVVMWINPLRCVFASSEWLDNYRECATAEVAERFIAGYAGQVSELVADNDERFDTEYLQDNLETLLWEMAHEDSTNPDGDMRDEAGKPDYKRFMSVSVTGKPTLESDIASFFHMESENGEIKMELRTIGDGVEEYCICRDGENYVLSRVFLDPFTDDETGKTYQITRLEPVLWSGSLGALYARYRALLAVKQ